MAMECIHVQCSYSAVYIVCKYNTVVCMCYSVYHYNYAHISTADFMVAPLALTFNSDTLSRDVVVTALPDTVSGEGFEDFSLSLTEDDTAVRFSVSTATVNFTDASKLVEYGLL